MTPVLSVSTCGAMGRRSICPMLPSAAAICQRRAPRQCLMVMWLQYFCVGMSLWDSEQMKQNSKEARSPTDPVELPYCEGLEIISASQLQQNPVVLTNNAGAPSTSEPARPQREAPPQRYITQIPDSSQSLSPRIPWCGLLT